VGGSAHSLPSNEDGSSTNVLFGLEIDADAFILRIRVWWSGSGTQIHAIRSMHVPLRQQKILIFLVYIVMGSD
jgi:hypothetical protein